MLLLTLLVGAVLLAPQDLAPAPNLVGRAPAGPAFGAVAPLDSLLEALPPGQRYGLGLPRSHPLVPPVAPRIDYKLKIYRPAPGIDYKLKIHPPPVGTDFTLRLYEIPGAQGDTLEYVLPEYLPLSSQ